MNKELDNTYLLGKLREIDEDIDDVKITLISENSVQITVLEEDEVTFNSTITLHHNTVANIDIRIIEDDAIARYESAYNEIVLGIDKQSTFDWKPVLGLMTSTVKHELQDILTEDSDISVSYGIDSDEDNILSIHLGEFKWIGEIDAEIVDTPEFWDAAHKTLDRLIKEIRVIFAAVNHIINGNTFETLPAELISELNTLFNNSSVWTKLVESLIQSANTNNDDE